MHKISSFQIWCLLRVSKKLGRWRVYHGVASPLLFKTVWIRPGIEVMSFWSFGVKIWFYSCLIQVYSCWKIRGHLWCIFCFKNVPNVLYMWKIWTAGRPIENPDSSTTKPCCCNQQPYHPATQDWLPTEAKQGWAWSVPGWETSWEN